MLNQCLLLVQVTDLCVSLGPARNEHQGRGEQDQMCKRFTGRLSRRRGGETSELHAGLVPMEEERKGKRMHGVSLRPPGMLSSFCLRHFGVCADSLCCLLRFGDAVLSKTPQLLQQMLFSLAQTLHVADKFRPAESHQRIQLGLSSQAGNSD